MYLNLQKIYFYHSAKIHIEYDYLYFTFIDLSYYITKTITRYQICNYRAIEDKVLTKTFFYQKIIYLIVHILKIYSKNFMTFHCQVLYLKKRQNFLFRNIHAT